MFNNRLRSGHDALERSGDRTADAFAMKRVTEPPQPADARSSALLSSLIAAILADGDEREAPRASTSSPSLPQVAACLGEVRRLHRVARAASCVTHDLRNLLMVINGRLDLARQLLHPEHPARAHLEIIEHAVQEGGDLAESLQLLARRQEASFAPVNFSSLVAAVTGQFAGMMRRRVSLRIMIEENLWVRGDCHQLRRVLLDLAESAGRDLPEGGELELRLARGMLPAMAGGPDLPAAALALTSRANRAGAEDLGGTSAARPKARGRRGVRLWLDEEIVAGHGGRVEVRSSCGAHHGVTLSLPLAAAEGHEVARESRPETGGISSRNVLILTRDREVGDLAAQTLREAGLAARCATDSELSAGSNYGLLDALVLDLDGLSSPAETIIDALNLRSDGARVIVIADTERITPAIKRRASCVLFKPVSIADVVQSLTNGSSLGQDEAA